MPPLARLCVGCDVRLDKVRCARCFSLQAPGDFACARCGQPLELEPLLDASDAPCPRCSTPLESASGTDARLHECPRCGGLFVPRDALAAILCSAEEDGRGPGARPFGADAGRTPTAMPVRYLPCPLCHATMNRVNFGKVSGVIVDSCRAHGTWFDAGELTRVVAFAAAGGLERTRERDAHDRRQEARRDAAAHAAYLAAETADRHNRPRIEAWTQFLRRVFSE